MSMFKTLKEDLALARYNTVTEPNWNYILMAIVTMTATIVMLLPLSAKIETHGVSLYQTKVILYALYCILLMAIYPLTKRDEPMTASLLRIALPVMILALMLGIANIIFAGA